MNLFDNYYCLINSRVSCCGHFKTNLEHDMLDSSEICFPSKENENTLVAIRHKSISLFFFLKILDYNNHFILFITDFNLNANFKNQAAVILHSVSIETVLRDDFKGIIICFR